jgi:hypothetical protein
MKQFTFKVEDCCDSPRVPLLLKELCVELENDTGGTFTILVTDDTELEAFRERMEALVDGEDERFIDMHRCGQTLKEGLEPDYEWFRRNLAETYIPPLKEKSADNMFSMQKDLEDTVPGIKTSCVIIVAWSVLPKPLREEIKNTFEERWKNGIMIPLYVKTPLDIINNEDAIRKWLVDDWEVLPELIATEEKLLAYLYHAGDDSLAYRILKLYPKIDIPKQGEVLIEVQW